MLENVEVLCHSSIKFNFNKTIYVDPFNITEDYMDADIIFITHDHYDHYDEESIDKIKKENTKVIVPKTLFEKAKEKFKEENIIVVEPDESHEIDGIKFKTVRAYNNEKKFHPRDKDWVGYIITLNKVRYYIMGDTDDTKEARSVICDVLFVPIGGIYTMNKEEAVEFTNYIEPLVAVPIHYGMVSGTHKDAEYFISNLKDTINGKILIKGK
jgi:L-ascorbate metabolism protein UlaG (beta-lactamase superfamily)